MIRALWINHDHLHMMTMTLRVSLLSLHERCACWKSRWRVLRMRIVPSSKSCRVSQRLLKNLRRPYISSKITKLMKNKSKSWLLTWKEPRWSCVKWKNAAIIIDRRRTLPMQEQTEPSKITINFTNRSATCKKKAILHVRKTQSLLPSWDMQKGNLKK